MSPTDSPRPDSPRVEDEILARIERRARTIWVRRRVAGVAAAAVLMVGIGVPVLAQRAGEDLERVEAADDPAPPTTTTTEPAATTSTSTTVPPAETTSTTAGAVVDTSTTTTTAGGPRPSQSWDGRNGGLKVKLTISPSDPVAGEVVTFRFEATDDSGHGGPRGEFGDGTRLSLGIGTGPGCLSEPQPPAGPSDATHETDHRYRFGGTFTLEVEYVTGGCWTPEDRVRFSIAVNVGEPAVPLPSNGPARPRFFRVEETHPSNAEDDLTYLWVSGQDTDGWVRGFDIDWGDTSPTERVSPKNEEAQKCVEPARSWPSSYGYAAPSHRYADPGTYTVTVTLESTGCDGAAPQTVSKTITIDVFA